MTHYEYIDHTGDIGVRVWGKDLSELFHHATAAFYGILFEPGGEFASGEPDAVELEATSVDLLLVEWLKFLLFEFSAHQRIACRIHFQALEYRKLSARFEWIPFDLLQDKFKTELKAVTYHQLSVRQAAPDRWEAVVIFDV